eukprot:m.120061 g.120061  ORF g.120061 m.120061 type:complete len:57 (+) comp19567_c0_seq2:3536-3706(+)
MGQMKPVTGTALVVLFFFLNHDIAGLSDGVAPQTGVEEKNKREEIRGRRLQRRANQ